MSGLPQIKCKYYNSGYCKFSRKESGCKKYHPTYICKITKCKDKTCRNRHPKVCRFKEECRFQLHCSYTHSKPEYKRNTSKEIKSLTEHVDNLKKEISILKVENYMKINSLVKVQLGS